VGDGLPFDATADGPRLKFLRVIDEHSPLCLPIRVGRCCKAKDVVAVLEHQIVPGHLGVQPLREQTRPGAPSPAWAGVAFSSGRGPASASSSNQAPGSRNGDFRGDSPSSGPRTPNRRSGPSSASSRVTASRPATWPPSARKARAGDRREFAQVVSHQGQVTGGCLPSGEDALGADGAAAGYQPGADLTCMPGIFVVAWEPFDAREAGCLSTAF
jgi:hypothetical protein